MSLEVDDQPDVIARPDAVTEPIECERGAPDAAVSVRVAGPRVVVADAATAERLEPLG